MSWPLFCLKDICLFQKKSKRKAGDGLKNGKFPFYTSSQTVSKWTNDPDYNLSPSLIFGTGGLPSVHITSSKFGMSGDCIAITPNDTNRAFGKYIFFYLIGNMRILEEGFKGAGLKHISKAYIENIQIPLPPLETQKQIVAVLEKANQLRKDSQQMEQELNSLAQSVFIDMFGDPVMNPKGFNVKALKDLVSVLSGGTPSKSNENFWIGDVPWVSPKDMKVTELYDAIDHVNEITFSETNLKSIPLNSILIVVRGMILVHTVPLAITRKKLAINQDIKALTVKCDSITSEFLLAALSCMHSHLLSIISTAAHGTKRIDMADLLSLQIIIPSLKSQDDYLKAISVIREMRSNQKSEAALYENNFSALMKKAFKGELTLL